MYYYDIHGWLSLEPIEGRSTDIVPPDAEGDMMPNFTGHKWILMKYIPPAPQEALPQVDILQRIEQLEKEAAELRLLISGQ